MPSNTSPRSSPNSRATLRAYGEAGSTPARCNPQSTLSHTCRPDPASARAVRSSSTTTRSVDPVSSAMRRAWGMWLGSMGNAQVRSSNPARANTSASTSVDTVSPRAPCASWRRPSSTHLWVLACGRSATPSCRARAAMYATLRSTTSRCSSSAGVSTSYDVPFPVSRFTPCHLLHDVELGLPSQDPAHLAVGPELGVFLLRRPHRLVVPFRQRRGGLQLDREPAVGEQAHVAAPRHAFLVVPQTDERSGPVAAVADRVRIDRAGNPRRPHLPQRGGEHLVSSSPRSHLCEQDVLQPVRVPEGQLQALRHVPLTGSQHVAHVLRVGVQAQCSDSEVAVQHVAALDHDGAGIR